MTRGRFFILSVVVQLVFQAILSATAVAGPPTPEAAAPSVEAPPGVIGSSPGPVVDQPGCVTNELPANDDGSTAEVGLPFELNFFGSTYSALWVNNNGNVTFGGPLSTFTPFDIEADTPPIIAPFLADVDTRGSGSGLVTYGSTTFEGRPAFCVDWRHVGYYSQRSDLLNDFQLLLVDRSDAARGDFDIVFDYDGVQWETGDASGGSGGLGGTSAGAGFSNGDGQAGHFYQLPGSLEDGAFLDSDPQTGLAVNDHGTNVVGRYVFHVTGAPGGASGGRDLSRDWPAGGYGYSFANESMPYFLGASHLALGNVIRPGGLARVFSDWDRNVAATGGQNLSIGRLGPLMAHGLCFGLALSAGRFDAGLEALYDGNFGRTDPRWAYAGTGPSATTHLPAPGAAGTSTPYDEQFLELVGDDFLSQFSTQVNTSLQRQHYAFADPTSGAERLRLQLEAAMAEGRNLYDDSGRLASSAATGFAPLTIQLPAPGGGAYFGHEVLAYSLEPLTGGAFQIDVWDDNFPGRHYAIVVRPDGSWSYDAPYGGGIFSADLSLGGAPGKRLGLLAALPLFSPANLNFYPSATGGLGTGSLVDVAASDSVVAAVDGAGEPVDIEPITADGTGYNGVVVDLPSDSGRVTVEGEDPSLDVRGEDTLLTAESHNSSAPVTFHADEKSGSVGGDEPDLDLSVADGQQVVSSEGAGELVFHEGAAILRDTSSHLRVTIEFEQDGAVATRTVFDGATTAGGEVRLSARELAPPESPGGGASTPASTPAPVSAPSASDASPPVAKTETATAVPGPRSGVSARHRQRAGCRKKTGRRGARKGRKRCAKPRHRHGRT